MPEQGIPRKKPDYVQQRDILIAVLLLAAVMIFPRSNQRERVGFQFGEDAMTLTGPSDAGFEVELPYKDILSISERDDLEVGTNLTGVDTDVCRFGVWSNETYGAYTLCAYPSVSQYIVLETADGVVVCNFESVDATRSLYTALVELLEQKRQGG